MHVKIKLATVVAFAVIETRVRSPLLPLRLFRSSQFTGANLTTLSEAQAKYIGVTQEGPFKPDSYRY